MKTLRLATVFVLASMLVSLANVQPILAGECFSDPVIEHDWTGTVTTGAYVRDVACMEGSVIVTSLTVGSIISVTGETDGWWRVDLGDGSEGWVGDWLLSVTETPVTSTTPTTDSSTPIVSLSATAAAAIRERVTGYILLQVEDHGEAWYVDPLTGNRFYMQDGPTAYEMMRTFGLGMTEADFVELAAGDDALIDRLRGQIVLRVQAHGEAYYIHPDGTVYYLADGPAAYALMREHSLGITNLDLTAITAAELELVPYGSEPTVLGANAEVVTLSAFQAGVLPGEFSIDTLNQAWLELANTERAERGVAAITLDQNLIDTTATWAAYMGSSGNFTHNRPYGESLLAWTEGFGLNTSDFGENLSILYSGDSAVELEGTLLESLALFMAQESYNGMHYQNVVDPSWNSTAVGFYFKPIDGDTYQVYLVFHFADIE
jgi:uncharacterized protein YkwD